MGWDGSDSDYFNVLCKSLTTQDERSNSSSGYTEDVLKSRMSMLVQGMVRDESQGPKHGSQSLRCKWQRKTTYNNRTEQNCRS